MVGVETMKDSVCSPYLRPNPIISTICNVSELRPSESSAIA